MTPSEFVARWKDSGGAEIANSHSFIKELCDLLDVPHPEPTQADEDANVYTFEKAVKIPEGDGTFSDGRIDCYRRGSFVLESKQGVERREAEEEALATVTKGKKHRKGHAERNSSRWVLVMSRARMQAKRYARAIPGEWPPFLMVVDVGYCIQLYADFSGSGKNYAPFPDPASYQIWLKDLEREEIRNRLRAIWLEPQTLDPSRIAAKVTRQLAERLAKLAKSLEGKREPKVVADFLMRCLFTMFAEDMEIGGFQTGDLTALLRNCRGKVDDFVPMMESLWSEMNTGHRMSGWLRRKIMQFNGGLFEDSTALPVTEDQLELLIEASEAKWNDVEPAIFGTLLERALDPIERHKLGAHYTPRAYVERLVMPTIIEPLREEWDNVFAAASKLYDEAVELEGATDPKSEKTRRENRAEAVSLIRNFHQKLCNTTVLDPACGSGNFLYVSMELMKRLEGEVLNALRDFGGGEQALVTIDPHQFKGIEVNPRAASITDLVLWIGYLQWHSRTLGKNAPIREPIIRKFHNIENRDAVLAWDAIEPVTDEAGNPVTRWDGRTMKKHPVTGEDVPDETARVQELRYINPRKAEWPKADYIVGNPPFVGNKKMREALGDGYASTIRGIYSDLPETCDYVMYWWDRSAASVGLDHATVFGLITTNSITQTFNRRVVERHLNDGIRLLYAIPDHPWVDSGDGAAVRIAMTVGGLNTERVGVMQSISTERSTGTDGHEVTFATFRGCIHSDLRIGANVSGTAPLVGNSGLVFQGCKLVGSGFQVSPDVAANWSAQNSTATKVLRSYWSGSDVTKTRTDRYVIDFFGLSKEQACDRFPALYQHVHDTVLPERLKCQRIAHRENWWLFGEKRPAMRAALSSLTRYIATSEVAKHRVFVFLKWPDSLADGSLAVIAHADAFILGTMSSRVHVKWAASTGGRMGIGNDLRYQNGPCFTPFPFPDPTEPQKQRIRELGEQLDAHRKRQQQLHPDLTMTGMYNVLEKLRSGEPLTAKERKIHDDGLVSVLKQIHDDLDAAVFEAYGWPVTLTDEEILERLVALNHERAAEEAAGKIRWLRPEFQCPQAGEPSKTQQTLPAAEPDEEEDDSETKTAKGKKKAPKAAGKATDKAAWPATLPERIRAVRGALTAIGKPATVEDIASRFTRANKANVTELLDTLVAVGQARRRGGKYAG